MASELDIDPLRTATSVLGVMAVAIRAGHETHRLVQGIRMAPKYIQSLATEMQGLYTLLAAFRRLLQNSRSQRDQTINDMLRSLHTTLCGCIEVFKDIKKTLSPYLDSHGDVATGRATFKRDEVMALQQTLVSYKAMLSMSLSTLSM